MSEPATRSWRCSPSSVKSALDELRRFGGTVAGGESEGTLAVDTPLGPLSGRFTYDGETFTIVVTGKPAMLPIQMIWDRVDRFCGPPTMMA